MSREVRPEYNIDALENKESSKVSGHVAALRMRASLDGVRLCEASEGLLVVENTGSATVSISVSADGTFTVRVKLRRWRTEGRWKRPARAIEAAKRWVDPPRRKGV